MSTERDIDRDAARYRWLRERLQVRNMEAMNGTRRPALADLIDNSHSIMAYDPDFARVYLKEKRLLLDEALRDGDPTLWAKADAIVRGAT